MALTAADILTPVSAILLDESNTRWSAASLLTYLNEAQRQLITLRPEAGVQTEIAQLQPGAIQLSPDSIRVILDVPRNMVDVLVPSTPNISIAATSADKDEGDAGTTNFTFTVTRNTAVGASSVTYAVGGTGTHPATETDFVGGAYPSGSVSWIAGETSKTITVAVAGDTTNEYDETFEVVIANPTNGVIAVSSAIGTIVNDDPGYMYLVTAPAAQSEVRAFNMGTAALSDALDTDSGILNALAYDPVGDAILGIRQGTQTKVTIASTGTISDVGAITGAPAIDLNAGSCSSSGVYYVGSRSDARIYRIDTLAASLVVTLDLALPGSDFEIDPQDGNLYCVEDDQCYVYDLSTGVHTVHTISGLPTGTYGVFGAQAIAGNYMYVMQNDDGAGNSVIYRFNWRMFGAAETVLTHVGTFQYLDGCRPLNPTFVPA